MLVIWRTTYVGDLVAECLHHLLLHGNSPGGLLIEVGVNDLISCGRCGNVGCQNGICLPSSSESDKGLGGRHWNWRLSHLMKKDRGNRKKKIVTSWKMKNGKWQKKETRNKRKRNKGWRYLLRGGLLVEELDCRLRRRKKGRRSRKRQSDRFFFLLLFFVFLLLKEL